MVPLQLQCIWTLVSFGEMWTSLWTGDVGWGQDWAFDLGCSDLSCPLTFLAC